MAHADQALIEALNRNTAAQAEAAKAQRKQAQAIGELADSVALQAAAIHALADAIASAGGEERDVEVDDAPAAQAHGYMDARS